MYSLGGKYPISSSRSNESIIWNIQQELSNTYMTENTILETSGSFKDTGSIDPDSYSEENIGFTQRQAQFCVEEDINPIKTVLIPLIFSPVYYVSYY